jgi:hypothetical protein
MCAPMLMAGLTLAMGAAQAVAGYQGQQAQYEAEQQRYNENVMASNQAAAVQYEYANRRIQQERAAAATEKADVAMDVREARAKAFVAAGESGVSGFSVDNLLAEFTQRGTRYANRVDQNLEMTTDQIQASKLESQAQAQSRINSLPQPQKPSFFDAGIRILGSALNAGQTFMQYKDA